MPVYQIQALQRDTGDNSEEKKDDMGMELEIKRKSHRHKQTNRHGGGSMFMTLHSHLDHFSTLKCAHNLQTTHCLI